MDSALAAGRADEDVDAAAALVLAESLDVALVTKHREIVSDRVPGLHC